MPTPRREGLSRKAVDRELESALNEKRKGAHRRNESNTRVNAALLLGAVLLSIFVGIAVGSGTPFKSTDNVNLSNDRQLANSIATLSRLSAELENAVDGLNRAANSIVRAQGDGSKVDLPANASAGKPRGNEKTSSIGNDVTSKDSEEATTPLVTYSGKGPRTLRPFTTEGPWSISWRGDDVFFFIRGSDGRLIHGDGGRGTGSYTVRRAGRYYLEVVARGAWSLSIMHV